MNTTKRPLPGKPTAAEKNAPSAKPEGRFLKSFFAALAAAASAPRPGRPRSAFGAAPEPQRSLARKHKDCLAFDRPAGYLKEGMATPDRSAADPGSQAKPPQH